MNLKNWEIALVELMWPNGDMIEIMRGLRATHCKAGGVGAGALWYAIRTDAEYDDLILCRLYPDDHGLANPPPWATFDVPDPVMGCRDAEWLLYEKLRDAALIATGRKTPSGLPDIIPPDTWTACIVRPHSRVWAVGHVDAEAPWFWDIELRDAALPVESHLTANTDKKRDNRRGKAPDVAAWQAIAAAIAYYVHHIGPPGLGEKQAPMVDKVMDIVSANMGKDVAPTSREPYRKTVTAALKLIWKADEQEDDAHPK